MDTFGILAIICFGIIALIIIAMLLYIVIKAFKESFWFGIIMLSFISLAILALIFARSSNALRGLFE